MKKKMIQMAAFICALLMLGGCSKTCKQKDCDSTDIYEDGYCMYHYALKKGGDTIRDTVNGIGDFFQSDK